MALVSNLLHRRQYGSVSSFNHPTENSIHFYIRPNEFVYVCMCMSSCRSGSKEKQSAKKEKEIKYNTTQTGT